jgi:hypothetical protein
MKIINYYRHNAYIVAFDDNSFIHWIEVKDMYRYLIDNFLLDAAVNDQKFQITFDEWLSEKDLASIDICSYILSQELKKKIMNPINQITSQYKNN